MKIETWKESRTRCSSVTIILSRCCTETVQIYAGVQKVLNGLCTVAVEMDIAMCKRSVSVGVMSLVKEASCRLERLILEVHMLRGFCPDGPLPTARGECLKKFVSGMGGVDNNLTCLRVLEACRSWRNGRLESIMSLAERMIC